ncbi:Imm51 family immunity protein [Nocardioides sp.]|uniref:Imm51 family immunity protein n=1 Tax=Nocardioides sp. TaxID=35761 RepID=UPI003514F5E0
MTLSEVREIEGEFSLTFYCGELPADAAIAAAGHEPNGYFWEGVAEFIGGDLVKQMELDSEGGMFCAVGEQADLTAMQSLLEPLLTNGNAVLDVIARAEAASFIFDD